MISIIIPVFKEPFLNKTIKSLLESSTSEIEIIPVIDGYELEYPLLKDKRIKPIYLKETKGMRNAINTGIRESGGEYIMKCDAHCLFGTGYDKILSESCKENWLMIPRRYSLDGENWKRDLTRPFKDYHYLNFPSVSHYGLYMGPFNYGGKGPDIDDTMSFQGSCWLANKEYFMEHVGFLDDRLETYGTFPQEQQEIGLKYWLGGGAVKVNKNAWYAHLSKRKEHYAKRLFSRVYKKNRHIVCNNTWAALHWINNEEPNMIHSFSWLIKKFSPVPRWSENWEEELKKIYEKYSNTPNPKP